MHDVSKKAEIDLSMRGPSIRFDNVGLALGGAQILHE
jgi:hypothetical protein